VASPQLFLFQNFIFQKNNYKEITFSLAIAFVADVPAPAAPASAPASAADASRRRVVPAALFHCTF
jgi:hypothetical protein